MISPISWGRCAVLAVAAVVIGLLAASPWLESPLRTDADVQERTAVVDDGSNASDDERKVPGEIGRLGVVDGAGGVESPPVSAGAPQNRRGESPTEQRYAGFTSSEHEVFKENFYCDLAEQARVTCERADRGRDAYEACLSLRSYPTYSRHCGYEP